MSEKCGACGCKEKASMMLIQTVGKKQKLGMCEEHRPAWSRNAAEVAANKYYEIQELK